MATLNSFDFSSCPFVAFAPADSPVQWVCLGFWCPVFYMRFMVALYPWVVSLHWVFGWQRTKLCQFVEQRNGSLTWANTNIQAAA